MSDLASSAFKRAEELSDYTAGLRRRFHKFPELALNEYKTAAAIEEELDKIGISHSRVGNTGVYAEIQGEKGIDAETERKYEAADKSIESRGDNDCGGNAAHIKTVLLRADIDALPIRETHECPYQSLNDGVMHACGHDAHAASLLAAAKILSENRKRFCGTVRLVFQPAEEIGAGAKLFTLNGYADNVDRAFGIHMASYVDVGKVIIAPGINNASVDWFAVNVKGRAAHISTPEQGINAAYTASKILIETPKISEENQDISHSYLIGIGKINSGDSYNIIAETARLEGTIRAFSVQARNEAKKRFVGLCRSTADECGGNAEIEWKDFASPLINDEAASREAAEAAESIFGKSRILTTRKPSYGGDDFAEFLFKSKGVYAYVGSRNIKIPETCVSHHNSSFDIDERALIYASALYASYALYVLAE